MTTTWRELGRRVTADLASAGIPGAEVEARRLVEAASGRDGADYHRVLGEPAPPRAVAALDGMATRRRAGEPLQYVIGRWGFRTLDLLVDRRVLIPRPETEVVVGHALDEIDRQPHRPVTVVDLGTGTGAIALSVAAERPDTEVWATDRSATALEVARANLAGAGRPASRVMLAQGSWFDALPEALTGAVDVVISNPPYVAADEDLPPAVADWEPRDALIAGPDGLEAVEAIITGAAAWLRPCGSVVIEIAPHQAEPATRLASRAGWSDVAVRPDLVGRDRALVARRAS
jgi:release factor glutamine methyltransferase